MTSLIYASNSFGKIIANIMSSLIANPEQAQPSIIIGEGDDMEKYFDHETSYNVVHLLRVYAYLGGGLFFLTVIMIYLPPLSPTFGRENNETALKKRHIKKLLQIGLRSPQFIGSFLMNFFSSVYF